MKRLPIRLKITLWFSIILIIVVALTYALILSVSNSVMQKNLRSDLIEIIESNVDEIEFYKSIGDVEQDYDSDQYIKHNNGYIEIDDDFLNSVNGIKTALYDTDGTFLYGENPIASDTVSIEFVDSIIQKVKSNDETYYIFDRKLENTGVNGMWLRGIVSEEEGHSQLSDVTKWSMILLPVLVITAILGGYFIARKSLQPIQHIQTIAAEIGNNKDLKKRINLGIGNDELHKLADTFDNMFDKLEDSFEAEKQFTSDVSHELRTPMAVIMAQSEYALETPMECEEYIESLQVIQRQGKKMSQIISDMLDFTRLERKTEKYQKEYVDFSALTESVCEDMSLLKENDINLRYEIQPNIKLFGNQQLLTRLLVNLISNAYRYGKEHGLINVTLCCEKSNAILKVHDNGIGIEKENLEKIFNRFYQVNPAHSSGSTGLGLAMVKEIVLYHDGTIYVQSVPKEGTEFIVSIPVKK